MMRRPVSRLTWYIIFFALIALTLTPILWMLSTSVKPEREIVTTEIHWIPQVTTLEHFSAILANYPMTRWLFNSLFTATAATLLVLVLDSLAGYAFARLSFRGRGIIFMIVLSMLFVPIQITVVPLFILFSRMGLTDTYWALILPVGANVTGVFLMRQFFLSIPTELEDAARVDGASTLRIFLAIILPLARPALTAVAILTFLSTWNSFFWPLIVTRSDDVRTLPVGIAQFLSLRAGMVQGQMSIGQSMAGAVLAAMPPIIVFIILQRYFIEGISRTGLKG
ncbi:MAG TPA: carbohydrate ABC transporter permease [Aggregatilineales bacterium]|nr:carbohydrate ABC transporter permease [Aggregatilineales bacterium]